MQLNISKCSHFFGTRTRDCTRIEGPYHQSGMIASLRSRGPSNAFCFSYLA